MGILRTVARFGKNLLASDAASPASKVAPRMCRFEQMESRRCMAADLHVGSVYYEQASGDDSLPNIIQFTFQGGAPGSEMKQIVIDGDKDGKGLSSGDIFFDTAPGGLGAFGSAPLQIVSHSGFEVVSTSVVDGGSKLIINLSGFQAGEKLIISIDVDEAQFVDGTEIDTNSLVEGGEFQRSHFLATFSAPHYFDVNTATLFWDVYDKNFSDVEKQVGTHLDLPPDRYNGTGDLTDMTAGAVATAKQIPLPITISGVVFVDNNLNVRQDSGEPGIAGVKLALWQFNGSTYVNTNSVVTTDASGHYEFENVLPGQYRIVEAQPVGYFSVGSIPGTVDGQTRGVVVNSDILSEINLLGGDDSIRNDFAEALPASISGHVHADLDADCIFDPEENGIAGVLVDLLDDKGNVIRSTRTDANGFYKFENLPPGTYGVFEHQPAGYYDSGDHPGSAGGIVSANDTITQITLGSGVNGVEYNFCENLPASISGHVHADEDGDCVFDPEENGIEGVQVDLRDKNGVVVRTTKTDANGNYKFENLQPGEYTVFEHQPAGFYDSGDHPGSAGGVVSTDDTISQIKLGSGVNAVDYNFCEKLPASISGYVHADMDSDCVFDPEENGIAGVLIQLLDKDGNVVATTLTDANGFYKFENLKPAEYGIHEVQPVGYFDSGDHPGSAGGVVSANDTITQITLGSGVDAVEYNFCEVLPASISGNVHADLDGDCIFDPEEQGVAGVRIELLDSSGIVIQTTFTDDHGDYKFENLAPGNYGIHEVQPPDYFDGGDRPGSAGGIVSVNDTITQIKLGSGVAAVHYDFCEIPPASISGYVYEDLNNNGFFDAGEQGIPGATLVLRDANGQPTGATTVSGTGGFYIFTGLKPGMYGVGEIQPAGYLDGLDSAGSAGGSAQNPGDLIVGAVLKPGMNAVHYDFGELKPVSISGIVLLDLDSDCVQDPGEPGLAGVTVQLLNSVGVVIATTTTGANGSYRFSNLTPGTYGVRELQPSAYFDGCDHPGSVGGDDSVDDTITEIVLQPGIDAVHYDFYERPPASISGIVFRDGPPVVVEDGEPADLLTNKTGVLKPGDLRLAGVVLELRNGVTGEVILGSAALPGVYAFNQPIRTVTDANGFYQFVGLAAGNYAVFEIQPDGYIDGLDTPGSLGGIAINPKDGVSEAILQMLTVSPNNDAILRISLPGGQNSINNNFSEITTTTPPPPVPFIPLPQFVPPPVPVPAAFIPPIFPPVVRVELPPGILIPTIIYGSGGRVHNYTWHLSVIDAGQPRGPAATDALVKLTGIRPDNLAWKTVNLSKSHWSFANRSKEGTAARKLLFGMKGGIPVTGDFNGDGRTDIGIFLKGQWFIDLNGNGEWDDGDLWAKLGHEDDRPVTGDWDGDGKTDIGIFGPAWPGDPRAVKEEPGLPDPDNPNTAVHKNVPPPWHRAALGVRSMKLTSQGKVRADLIDHVFHYGSPKDIAIVGDWNGDGTDTIGIFHDGSWYRDLDGDGKWTTADAAAQFGEAGNLPVVGDWNGDGVDDIGVYRDGVWYLDTNGNGMIDGEDQVVKLGGRNDVPIVGDWDGDGRDEPGVYHDGRVMRAA